MNIFKNSKKGFTLVELMVVVAIIVILTGIITTNFAQSKAKARDAKKISDVAQIQLALELFFDRCNAYPRALDISEECPINSSVLFGNYISKIPTPNNTDQYDYAVNTGTGMPTDYVLRAILETNNSALDDSYSTNINYYIGEDQVEIICESDEDNFLYCVKPN